MHIYSAPYRVTQKIMIDLLFGSCQSSCGPYFPVWVCYAAEAKQPNHIIKSPLILDWVCSFVQHEEIWPILATDHTGLLIFWKKSFSQTLTHKTENWKQTPWIQPFLGTGAVCLEALYPIREQWLVIWSMKVYKKLKFSLRMDSKDQLPKTDE